MKISEMLVNTVTKTTEPWAKLVKSVERSCRAVNRKNDWNDVRPTRLSIKAAAYSVMPQAYAHASSDGQYVAHARQIYYAGRPGILEMTGAKDLDSGYFTQTLLPNYLDAYRYHLFFRHPSLPSKAKETPWHPKLEFRGKGALVVLPPSLHRSGLRYDWAAGLGLWDVPLPPVPEAILEALRARPADSVRPVTPAVNAEPVSVPVIVGLTRFTYRFLRGDFAQGPNWNVRLFRAACDLHAHAVPLPQALPLLLAGARPWNAVEAENARRTIASAYSEPRVPGYRLASQNTSPVAVWQVGTVTIRQFEHHLRRYIPPADTIHVQDH